MKGNNIPEDYIFIEWNPDKIEEDIFKGYLPVPEDEFRRVILTNTRAIISPNILLEITLKILLPLLSAFYVVKYLDNSFNIISFD